MKSFSYAELDQLAGEVLPERAVLSTLFLAADGDSYNNNNAGNHGAAGGTGSTVVTNACQSNVTQPHSGLLQLVGLNTNSQTATFTCMPGAVASGH
ncbi:hypothetical protein [Actinomadura rudentiformis]|uniref:Uncharacterized protein n=1 Tax=Actinomadura rudentiformis TaxID=359158 RepID=A0A6H9YKJ5_9ACTN|nr:hypothetical protein [Actinomadura rudentiformis]KAB2342182.1 hypothetical protein F8566_39680 [Actinomadura rudentiformis]